MLLSNAIEFQKHGFLSIGDEFVPMLDSNAIEFEKDAFQTIS